MKMIRCLFPVLLLLSALLSGCGNSPSDGAHTDASGEAAKVSEDPVTLKVFQDGANISDEEFQKLIADPVKQKYPNITLQLTRTGEGSKAEDLLATGNFPDLIYTSDKNISRFKRLGLATDLNPMVKKFKLDLGRFEPSVIDTIKVYGDKGELFGVPYKQNLGVMIYNKDLFNKFGVPFPIDGMDWEQVVSLGRKLTREADGVQYIGIDPGTISYWGMGLSLPYMDEKTNKAAINNDQWKKVYQAFQEALQVPGYIGPNNKYKYGNGSFFKDKVLAMNPQWINSILNNLAKADGTVDWDLVSQPNFKENVGTGREVDAHLLMISSLGKHQDQAFQVITVITGDEAQRSLSAEGRISVLANAEIQKKFGANLPEFKGKNIAGIFKAKPRKTHIPALEYDHIVRDVIDDSAKEMAAGTTDINTLLRDTEAKANQAIEEAK